MIAFYMGRVNSDDVISDSRIQYMRDAVLKWAKKNGRSYPWRDTMDPYGILIAEIMLRRTRANQVQQVYVEFMKRYPSIESLSKAESDEIQQFTYSLGLHWRNRTLPELAQLIISKHVGNIPKERDELVKLPGIGEYVAGMFLSSAFNRIEWIVDTNIVRVFSRFFDLKVKGDGRRDKNIVSISKRYVNCRHPRLVNFAIIDFAALMCKKIPLDTRCPIHSECAYNKRMQCEERAHVAEE